MSTTLITGFKKTLTLIEIDEEFTNITYKCLEPWSLLFANLYLQFHLLAKIYL